MIDDAVLAIEYESMIFGRHLAGLPGRSRRTGGVLDQSAYVLLSILEAGGPASIGELVNVTRLDASTLNRQTSALLREGYAARIPDPDGGIARKFEITAHGADTLRDERQASCVALEKIIADWDQADRKTFAILLMQINRATEERYGRAWPRPALVDATGLERVVLRKDRGSTQRADRLRQRSQADAQG